MNTPDHYAERLPAHLLQSEKHPSAPPAKFTMQCNFPSLLRGLLGEKKGKRKGREGKEGKKGKEREGRRSGKGEERRKGKKRVGERGERKEGKGRERERESGGVRAKCMAFKRSSFQRLWLGCRFAESLDP